jgi:hypothetical protein
MSEQPCDQPQPQPLRDADMRGCRMIAGEPLPLRRGMYCGAKARRPGESWCSEHWRVVYRGQGHGMG